MKNIHLSTQIMNQKVTKRLSMYEKLQNLVDNIEITHQ